MDLQCLGVHRDGQGGKQDGMVMGNVSGGQPRDCGGGGDRAEGGQRWREENEGFNTQKNSGLNLEHAYSHTCWAAYYFLLQIAHLLLQLVEKGSLLRHLAQEQGKRTAVELFGSLKNLAQRLLESLRYLPGLTRLSTEWGQVASRSAWTAVRPSRWRVGVSQVEPRFSGSDAGRTRSRVRARPLVAVSGPQQPPGRARATWKNLTRRIHQSWADAQP